MTQADYQGARGANAGDDFHELWALRQALTLLDPDTRLSAITVEGLRAEDERGTPSDTWDGVDCTFYFGGDRAPSATRIVIDQLKYSAANPNQTWTIARLTHASNKNRDNSVISRLAKAFSGIKQKRPDLVTSGNVVLRLVSNQPVDPVVIAALLDQLDIGQIQQEQSALKAARTALLTASGLQGEDCEAFVRSLDFSECGSESRFALEERVLTTVSDWTDDDARAAVNALMRFVRRTMMPEAKNEFITRQSILIQLGFSDSSALFPCPTAVNKIDQLVSRVASHRVVEQMLSSNQRICLHGGGGCGKTTTLQEIETLLPHDSVVVIFDCYGGGQYLDSNSFRHRPQDAFLQLSNDLARQLRIPLLVSRSIALDYARTFKKRLTRAAEVVAARSPTALLVVVVDAADNSVTAASTQSPPERSFVHDFVALGDLPLNVRLLVTARTGRLPTLNLPRSFTYIEVTKFTGEETAAHVRLTWSAVPTSWLEDFDHLSGGNPRVQRYALDYAGDEPAHALNYLRPNGKGLDQIFLEQLEQARRKVGHNQDIQSFCAGLIALPRPVPVADLAAVTSLSEAHILDLSLDIAPGVQVANKLLSFADEDFEHFVRNEAESQLNLMQTRIADHFASRYKNDAYAATHIAAALLAVRRRREIIDLISAEDASIPIGDPILRREVHLQRLRIAMKVCREADNTVDALLTLLVGAEALKTNTAIHRTLVENPDLTATFAHVTSATAILRDPNEIEHHGPLLYHSMAADAREGNAVAVREGHRQVQAWMQRRAQDFADQKKKHPHTQPNGWTINYSDIAAETEALLRIGGPQQAVDGLTRWHPKYIALLVAPNLATKLITSGEAALVERCLSDARIPSPWDVFLLVPLALAGKPLDLSRIEASLSHPQIRRLIRLDKLQNIWGEENPVAEYLNIILVACEIVIARSGDLNCVVPILERIADPEWRRRDQLARSNTFHIELSIRAHTLLERLAGRQATLETFWVDPPTPAEDLAPRQIEQQKRWDSEKKEELKNFIGPILDVYDVRAQTLIGLITSNEVETHLQKAITRYHSGEYYSNQSHYAPAMRTRAALALARLLVLPQLKRSVLWECIRSILALGEDSFGLAEAEVFATLALDHSLHEDILHGVTARTEQVKRMKTSAQEKIHALVRFARVLLPISRSDAESLFNDAIEVAGEVNAEAVHEIALFAPLAVRGVSSMRNEERRIVARDLAIIVSNASVRLAGGDHFPWDAAAQALTTLDICLALAAVGRWEDENIVKRTMFLPRVLEIALSQQTLSPAQVAALSPLLDTFGTELIVRILSEATKQNSDLNLNVLIEGIAQEEILRFGQGVRQEVSEILNSASPYEATSFWLEWIKKAAVFHSSRRTNQATPTRSEQQTGYLIEPTEERPDPFDCIDWTAHRFVSVDDINAVIGRVFEAAQASHTHIAASTILYRIGNTIKLGDRVAHLEALSGGGVYRGVEYEVAQHIAGLVDTWQASPSVFQWCRERLLQVVVDMLPEFSRWLHYGQSPLPTLLERSGASSQQITATLLEAVERHVDALDAATTFALVGLIAQHCTPDDAAQVMTRYAHRLVQHIPPRDRDKWDTADIPVEPANSIARLLYALMGDIDVRNRWRSAHVVRCLARFGDTKTLDALVGLYNRTSEPSYRQPDLPFYWLAARLWLVIALDRIAVEIPAVVRQYGIWLLDVAKDEAFPHVLLRSFAKSAVSKLVQNRHLDLNEAQRDALKRANTSPLRRKKAQRSRSVHFDRYKYQQRDTRRFRFDSMDTLPYWYTAALETFVDVTQEMFLDTAERWIVDQWGIQNNPWTWDDEPRKHRDDWRSSMAMDHHNGSRPIFERFHTYLEWHAMWCATGELMQTHPLVEVKTDDYHSFEDWLRRESLTVPPLWVADLHGMKPLEDRLWFSPQGDVNVWMNSVCDDDFLTELGLVSDNAMLTVGSRYDTRSRNFGLSTQVETALVSPETASALTRALQTVTSRWHYKIPSVEDDLQINVPPYKLVGWLVDGKRDIRIDEHDLFRYEVSPIQRSPSEMVTNTLQLEFVYANQAAWVDTQSRNPIIVYEAWGDNRDDEREERRRYDETVRSSGWRLQMTRSELKTFLDTMQLDLIVEVEIIRRNKGYDDWRNEEKKKEVRYDRILILRRDGSIESAEGRLGTWTAPCA